MSDPNSWRDIVAVAAVIVLIASASCLAGQTDTMASDAGTVPPALEDLTVTIVYDNVAHTDGLRTAWGFAAYVTGPEKNILFDTGGDGTRLLANMEKLALGPNRVETVVLSHIHGDHTGELAALLEAHSDVSVRLPASIPQAFKDTVRDAGAAVVEVNEPCTLCENVYATGVLGEAIREQALVLKTQQGLVVLTGCAHPGIVPIVERVRSCHEEEVLLVMGGFHLGSAGAQQTEQIMVALKAHGVRYVAPTHCTGDAARELFAECFGSHCIGVGAGATVTLAALP